MSASGSLTVRLLPAETNLSLRKQNGHPIHIWGGHFIDDICNSICLSNIALFIAEGDDDGRTVTSANLDIQDVDAT